MRLSFVVTVALAVGLLGHRSVAQVARLTFEFEEVSAERGIPSNSTDKHGQGIAAADVDDDGDIDLFIPNKAGTACQLLINQGDGTFLNQATAVGLDDAEGVRVALWFDYNGDGRLDLLTSNDVASTSFKLFQQQEGLVFVETTAAAGLEILEPGINRGGMCAADIDNDDDLDFYAGIWDNAGNDEGHMFQNNGDGTFTDISVACGVRTNIENTQWQPTFFDFNEDGWMDLYQAVDFDENRLWLNDGDGTFTDVSVALSVNNSMNDMGAALGDYNHDGKMDLFVTNIFNTHEHSILLRNETSGGSLAFTEVSKAQGIADGGWGWGCTFFDADNDGWVDLAATNGFGMNVDSTRFYRNQGHGPRWFSRDLAEQAGIQDFDWGVSLIAVDLDRDGDMDLMQTTHNSGGTVRLWDNRPTPDAFEAGNYLVIQPRQSGANKRAIGSIVRASTSFNQQMRFISAGTSYIAQEPAEAHFGLGWDESADVEVQFPDGDVVEIAGLRGGGVVQVGSGPVSDMRFVRGTWRTRGSILALSSASRLWLRSSTVPTIEVGFQVDSSSTTFDVSLESRRLSTQELSANLQAFNWTTEQFDDLDTWELTNADTVHPVSGVDATDYVNGVGRVLVRARAHRPEGPPFAVPGALVTFIVNRLSVTGNP